MPPPHISLNELYQMQNKKQKSKKVVFDKVLELCHRRIRNIGTFGGMNTFYEVPGLLIGFPLYNINDCTEHVVEQLRKSGFMVQILPPPQICVLYISWDPNELKTAKKALKALPNAQQSTPLLQNQPPSTLPIHSRLALPPTKKEVKWNFLLDE